jgi:hypothetical protein
MEQYTEILLEQNKAVDVISLHLYGLGSYLNGSNLQTTAPIRVAAKATKSAGKLLYLGEFGNGTNDQYRNASDRAYPLSLLDLQVSMADDEDSVFALSTYWSWDCPSHPQCKWLGPHREEFGQCLTPGREDGSDAMIAAIQAANTKLDRVPAASHRSSPLKSDDAAVAFSPIASAAAPHTSVTSACPSSDITASLFAALDLTLPSLAVIAAAHQRGDIEAACTALSNYYLSSATGSHLRLLAAPPTGTSVAGGAADAALKDSYAFYGEISTVPRNMSCGGQHGGLDWMFSGPIHDEVRVPCLPACLTPEKTSCV